MKAATRRLIVLWIGVIVIGACSGAIGAGFVLSAFRHGPILVPTDLTPRPALESDVSITQTVARVLPSVVSIDITEKPATSTRKTPTADIMHIGGGSGFFISDDGLVVTNKHVISETDVDYTVIAQDGSKWPAKVLALDPTFDLGVLKIDAPSSSFPSLALGDSDALQTGQTVIAIGNALAEFQNTVTKGVISGLNRSLYAGDYGDEELIEEAIQTDAAINPGNSGGPLINLNGEVVGMNTAISDGAQSLGFALPSSVLSRAIDSVRKYGRIVRPWIGVRFISVDESVQSDEKLPESYGAFVSGGTTKNEPAVEPGSPAAKAGLKDRDLILEVDGVRVDDQHSLTTIVSKHEPGDVVVLKIWRAGKELQIPLTLEERPTDPTK
ncbi:MAG TPA: trypsin-like peptidase domain-containing protein [Verrucomicrobiae bacterium]|nr:trypsin-like peptidase domain-containing protein [Verrucomicrobiae bacterium]